MIGLIISLSIAIFCKAYLRFHITKSIVSETPENPIIVISMMAISFISFIIFIILLIYYYVQII